MSLNYNSLEGNPYLFISHSHQDIREVRIIRNELEESGFEPICFYLASLTDSSEILDLIKREIDARRFFVYVDSPNARRSTWVQSELRYLKSRGREIDRVIILGDNSEQEGSLQHKAEKLMGSVTIFISYRFSRENSRIVGKIEKASSMIVHRGTVLGIIRLPSISSQCYRYGTSQTATLVSIT